MHQKLSLAHIVSGLAWLVLLLSAAQPVAAHGPGQSLELAAVPVGPYYLSVWSAPASLRPGEIHFETAVTDAEGLPVPDCDISLQIVSLAQEEKPIRVRAQPLTGDRAYRQAARLKLLTTGSYQVVVRVTDPAGLGDEASLAIEVTAVPLSIKMLLYTSISLTAAVALWLFRRGLILFKLWPPTAVPRRPIR